MARFHRLARDFERLPVTVAVSTSSRLRACSCIASSPGSPKFHYALSRSNSNLDGAAVPFVVPDPSHFGWPNALAAIGRRTVPSAKTDARAEEIAAEEWLADAVAVVKQTTAFAAAHGIIASSVHSIGRRLAGQ